MIRYLKCRRGAVASAGLRGGRGSRSGGRSGAEVRGGRRRLGGEVFINRSPRRAAGKGRRARPLPHSRVLGPGGTLGCSTGCPPQRDPQPVAEGVSPTFVPWRNAALLDPVPRSRRSGRGTQLGGGCRPPGPTCRGCGWESPVLCTPGPPARDALWAGREIGRRTLSFRRRNAVSVPPPDSAPGIRLLVTFFQQINKQFLPCGHFERKPCSRK